MSEIIIKGRDQCVECGESYPVTDLCRFDGKCFYCCKHEPFPDGPQLHSASVNQNSDDD